MRSLSPSTTRVWTRTESPTRNAGIWVLNCSFSMASMMRFMTDRLLAAQDQFIFFFKQKTAYDIGLGIPAEPLFRSKKRPACSELRWAYCNHKATYFASYL